MKGVDEACGMKVKVERKVEGTKGNFELWVSGWKFGKEEEQEIES